MHVFPANCSQCHLLFAGATGQRWHHRQGPPHLRWWTYSWTTGHYPARWTWMWARENVINCRRRTARALSRAPSAQCRCTGCRKARLRWHPAWQGWGHPTPRSPTLPQQRCPWPWSPRRRSRKVSDNTRFSSVCLCKGGVGLLQYCNAYL